MNLDAEINNSHADLFRLIRNFILRIFAFYTKVEEGKISARVYDPNIALAMTARGKIFYYTKDPDVAFKDKQKIEEDYQTALQIVQESKL